jgi:acetylornithine aminotransferase
MDTYKRWPVELESGRGAVVYDGEGRPYIDLVGGIAVASVGHCHPAVVDAIARQAARLIHVSNLYATRPQVELAERLSALTGGMRAFFCNSGAEAIECALKIVRKWGRTRDKARVIAADGGFHGRTFGALAVTGQPAKQEPFAPMLAGIDHVPYGDPVALEDAMGADVAAVVLEPIQGEAGVVVPPLGYLRAARSLCDRHGALLVLDEIQTGLGRTGAWFGYEHERVGPDVVCLAKALAGGLPMGACLAVPEVAAELVPGDHATTFGGGPVQSAAALATLGVIEAERLVARAATLGTSTRARLGETFGPDRVRGRGLLIGSTSGRLWRAPSPRPHSMPECS